MEEICAVDGVEGICLNYCRLIDVVLPVSLAYNYNRKQDTEVANIMCDVAHKAGKKVTASPFSSKRHR